MEQMKSDVKRIETLAAVFIVLALLTRISSLGMETWTSSVLGASRQMDALRAQGRAMLTLWNFVRVMVNIGIGTWLFISAGKDGRARWVWGLFGLTGGLTAAVLYVLVDLADTIKGRKESGSEQSDELNVG
jgi:hypothetical protein